VEGGEYDFLLSYDKVLCETQYLVVEWHSWHRGGGSSAQILQMAESRGFSLLRVIQEPQECEGSSNRQVGVYLLGR
jgi:hypothetical protein